MVMTKHDWKLWLMAGGVAALLSIPLIQNAVKNEPPGLVLAGKTANERTNIVAAEIARAKVGDEIVSLRSENAKTFKGAGGQLRAEFSAKRRFYLDAADGVYKPINLSVHDVADTAKKVKDRKFDKYVDAGLYRATWKENRRHDYDFYGGDHHVSWTSLTDTTDVPVKTEYTVDGVKQTLTLGNDSAPKRLMWTFETDALAELKNGSVVFSDSAGTELFRTTAPTAWDAVMRPVSVAVSLIGNTLIYDVDCDGAEYPVTVDPTTVIYNPTAAYSGVIIGSNATYSKTRDGAYNATVYAGSYQIGQATGYYIYRNILALNTASLHTETVIDSAKIVFVMPNKTYVLTDFSFNLVEGTFTAGALDSSMYNDFTGFAIQTAPYTITELGSAPSTASYAAGDTIRLKLNATGLTKITKGTHDTAVNAWTKFVLLSSRDVAGTTPTGSEYVTISTPYLQIWYHYSPYTAMVINPSTFKRGNVYADSTNGTNQWTGIRNYTQENTEGITDEQFFIGGDDDDGAGHSYNYRVALTYPTYILPDGVGLDSVKVVFKLNDKNYNGTGPDYLLLIQGTWTPATQNLYEGWYNDFTGWASSGAYTGLVSYCAPVDLASYSDNDTVRVKLSATGAALISSTDYTKIMIIGHKDSSGAIGMGIHVIGKPYLQVWYDLNPNPPTDFAMALTGIAGPESLYFSYTKRHSASVDGVTIRSADSTLVSTLTVTQETGYIGGLTPNLLCTYHVRIDSLGLHSYSNAVSRYTRANPPNAFNFSQSGLTNAVVNISFGANSNSDSTQYAIRDSTQTAWVQFNGTTSSSPHWATRAAWLTRTISSYTVGNNIYRIIARNGDSVVNTTPLIGTLNVYTFRPTGFTMTPLSGTTMRVEWTNQSANYTSLRVENNADSALVLIADAGTTVADTATGLSPGTEYTWYVEADSSGVKGASNTDTEMTYPNAPSLLKVPRVFPDSLYFMFDANSNPAAVTYSIRITYPSGAYTYWSGTDTTGTETFKTKSAWGDSIHINQRLTVNTNYWIATRAKSTSLDYSAWVTIGARTWNATQVLVLNALREMGTSAGGEFSGYYPSTRGMANDDSINYNSLKGLGQKKVGSKFLVMRYGAEFHIPSHVSPVRDTLYFSYTEDSTYVDFDIQVFQGTWMSGATKASHYHFDGWDSGMTIYTGDILNTTYNTADLTNPAKIALNGLGIAYYNLCKASGDTLKLKWLSYHDIAADSTNGTSYIDTITGTTTLHAAWDSTEVVPVFTAVNPISATSLELTWTDLPGSNRGYRIVDSVTGEIIAGSDTSTYNATSKTLTGLSPNTLYSLKVEVVGGALNGQYSNTLAAYTWPNVPGTPTVSNPSNDSLKVIVDANGNPAATKFLIFAVTSVPETLVINRHRHILQSVTPFFVNSDSLNTSIADNDSVWATYTNFGGAGGITVGSEPGKTYTVEMLSKSGP